MSEVQQATEVQLTAVETPKEPIKADKNYFVELAKVDVSNYIKKKNGFSYLSWAYAVDQLKRRHPDAIINVRRFPEPESNGALVPYLRTKTGYFVEVEVIVDGVSVSEPFPVTDHRNKPIATPTAFDINNSIQRAKVKAIAGHGLGLNIYAGEDLPIESDDAAKGPQYQPKQQYNQQQQYQQQPQYQQQAAPPQAPPVMSQQQQMKMREIATAIAHQTLGAGATEEALVTQLKAIYERHKIVSNLPYAIADVKIGEMNQELKQIIDSRMAPAQPAVAQVASTSPFEPLNNTLANVI